MRSRLKVFGLSVLVSVASVAEISIEAGTPYSRPSSFPKSASGITYAGGDVYYVVADNAIASEDCALEAGLYRVTLSFADDGRTVTGCDCSSRVPLAMASDLEACAFDPASGNVWCADERRKTIVEYDPETGEQVSSLDMPALLGNIHGNYGLESLTISGDGLVMWTANEESLLDDGPLSSYYASATNRLVKFTRKTVNDKWRLSAMYPYVTDRWHRRHDYGGVGRRGISDMCALPDGSVLVLERELSTDMSGTDVLAGWGVEFHYSIYRITQKAMVAATDVKEVASLGNGGWIPVAKGVALNAKHDVGWNNYEGICLGRRLSDNSCEVVMLTDGGDGITSLTLLPNVLAGIGDVKTIAFSRTASAVVSIHGSNFRFRAGDKVEVSLLETRTKYTTGTGNGTGGPSYVWHLLNHVPSSGTGTSHIFTVDADDTFIWTVSSSDMKTVIPVK